jgi:mitogen-activated protein kinase 1/3
MDLQFISDERAKNYIKSFGYKERTPFKSLFKFISPDIEDFLLNSLEFNPNKRMTINKALNHKIFDDIR